MLPQPLLACLSAFESCFTAPSYQRFTVMMSGWLLCVGKRTITGVMRSAGVADRHPSGFHRFFSRGAWAPDEVGRVVLQQALKLVPPGKRVMLTLDDTLARHTGKRIASAGMHRDPLLSTGNRPFFHFGHNWVVLAVVVEMPWGKRFSLPFYVRLYRSVKAAAAANVEHVKRTVMAAQMLADLAKAQPKREFLLLTDNAYVNRSIVGELPQNIDLIGRGRMDAALYTPPPTYSGRGRPRLKGKRLDTPQQRADKRRFKKLDVVISGRQARVLPAVVHRGNLRLGQASTRTPGRSQSHRARSASHDPDGIVGLLPGRHLVRPLDAAAQEAAFSARPLAARQDRPELRGHACLHAP